MLLRFSGWPQSGELCHHTTSGSIRMEELLSQSAPHKLLSNGKSVSPLSAEGFGVRRFLAGVFVQKYPRKGYTSWKKSFYRYLIFFMLGFLLGMAPFGDFDNVRSHDFFFENKPPTVKIQEDVKDVVVPIRDNIAVRTVQLGVKELDFVPRKLLIVVTPTYNRSIQDYYLNRLAQVLKLVRPPILWIVVEMNGASMETAEILRKTGVMYRHLVCSKNMTDIKDRRVHQRNTALEHIEQHRLDGIVYFADDDNIYSLELFESIRGISRFGTWPVAMLAQSKNEAILEGPVCNGSQVIGWHTNNKNKQPRGFHVDISGFAFNSTILWDPKRWHRPTSDPIRQVDTLKDGFQETTFIEQVVEDESQMEGVPAGCSRIMNWHLHFEAHQIVYPKGELLQKNLDIVLPTK